MIENTELGERNEQSTIERIVMNRVRLLRILGLIISTAMLVVLTFIATLWGVGREVWVARVFENMPHTNNLVTFTGFWLSAFMHTQLLVQVLTLLTLASFIYLTREIASALASFFTSSRA